MFAEVVYREGAHPALEPDGGVPGWLSGAPAGATGPGSADAPPGGAVLRERLVVDVDAFGQDLSATRARLDRLRQRGRWLDADGHLLLDARYATWDRDPFPGDGSYAVSVFRHPPEGPTPVL